MSDAMRRIREIGIVPVIKLDDAAQAESLGRALAAGGVPIAEVTFRTPAAAETIRAMTDGVPELLVGAGTVTTVEQAKSALSAGARFIVSPAWEEAVIDYCLERGVAVLPGVSGPDGVARGVAKGLEVLKFFPAEVAGGVAMIDALAGPFGGISYLPTGGIDATNIGEYARRPQVHAVGGSWMVKSSLVEARDWTAVERLCREAVFALHGFSFAHMGMNREDEKAARSTAALFSSLFGLAPKEGSSSVFAAESIEITKTPFRGTKGHIGFRCNDVERAIARFASMGIKTVPETQKLDKGRIKAIYLDLEIAGFAIHLAKA